MAHRPLPPRQAIAKRAHEIIDFFDGALPFSSPCVLNPPLHHTTHFARSLPVGQHKQWHFLRNSTGTLSFNTPTAGTPNGQHSLHLSDAAATPFSCMLLEKSDDETIKGALNFLPTSEVSYYIFEVTCCDYATIERTEAKCIQKYSTRTARVRFYDCT